MSMDRLGRKELIELVQRIINGAEPEEDINDMIALVSRNVPDPNVSDLIYWHHPELTAEEVVEKALTYKAIEL